MTYCQPTPGPAECIQVGCPNTAGGPVMVILPAGFCIDRTEVTQGQYRSWLETNPSTASQPSVCSWNTSFLPDAVCATGSPSTCQGAACADLPQACVDWCDAYAYCAAVGKRLCGKIGGGSNVYADYANATLSQWYAACTSDGAYAYPYGNTYEPTACNGVDDGIERASVVGSLPGCRSPLDRFNGVYDLSGNLWEWEDSCAETSGASDLCWFRGGSYGEGQPYLSCANASTYNRDAAVSDVGFRCCAEWRTVE